MGTQYYFWGLGIYGECSIPICLRPCGTGSVWESSSKLNLVESRQEACRNKRKQRETRRAQSAGTILDNTKAILKWDGDTPSYFNGLTTYTHSEIRTELAKSDWTNDA